MHDPFAANRLLYIGIVIIFCFQFWCIKLCDTLGLQHTEGFLFHESVGYFYSRSLLSEFEEAFFSSDSEFVDLVLNFPVDLRHRRALHPGVHLVFLDHLGFEAEGGNCGRLLRVELVLVTCHCSLLRTARGLPDIAFLLGNPGFALRLLSRSSHQPLRPARRLYVRWVSRITLALFLERRSLEPLFKLVVAVDARMFFFSYQVSFCH